jgi:nucleoside-diphosphate-sugar epimerase
LEGVDKLVHVAAVGRGTSSSLMYNNVIGSRILLEKLVEIGKCKDILLVSSIAVYGLHGLKVGSIVDEGTLLEPNPELRDLYTYSKILQENTFRRYMVIDGKKMFNLCIVRPGPIYGHGGTVLPARIGMMVPFLFLNFGGGNRIPITYVENCAEAIAFLSGRRIDGMGVYNVVDPDLPTATQYLRKYTKYVKGFRYISLPFTLVKIFSRAFENYSVRSEGQIPPIITRYKAENQWKRVRYDNSKILREGWRPVFSTEEGLDRTFKSL